MKKDNVYARSDEKFVKTVVLYADGSDKLFYDAAAKVDKVATADLKDLFLKGVTIMKDNVYYSGICLKTNTIIGHDGTTAKTFKPAV